MTYVKPRCIRIAAICLVALVFAALAIPANAVTIEVTPQGDGYYHNELGTSYDFFEAGANPNPVQYTYYGSSETLNHNTSYVQFSLSSIPAGSSIGSATLNIYLESAFRASSEYAGTIKHATNASSANGNASQKIGGSELVANIAHDIGLGWKSFDITDMLQADLDNGYSYSCFSFHAATDGDSWNKNSGFSFASGESNNKPFLNVVPEPMTISVLLTGAAALLRRRRR